MQAFVVIGILLILVLVGFAMRKSQLHKEMEKQRRIERREAIIAQTKQYTLRIRRPRFTLGNRQVVYVEGRRNDAVNSFIVENYDKIYSHFQWYGYEFCYMPYISKRVNDIATIDYFAPYHKGVRSIWLDNDFLLEGMSQEEREAVKPSLLYVNKQSSKADVCFNCVEIDLDNLIEDNFGELLDVIMRNEAVFESRIRYSLCDNHAMTDYVNAEYPDAETHRLIAEIEHRVEQLEQRGISEEILLQIVAKPRVVSRMVITRDYRIILPDYNDMEISMTPLVKAIYFLFLRHPEGVNFKDLVDYRNELISLYTAIKGSPLDDNMTKSIYRATDPTDNSINEKVARIREAFVTRFDERLAVNYIIQGERGEAKRIPLHREFVKWE